MRKYDILRKDSYDSTNRQFSFKVEIDKSSQSLKVVNVLLDSIVDNRFMDSLDKDKIEKQVAFFGASGLDEKVYLGMKKARDFDSSIALHKVITALERQEKSTLQSKSTSSTLSVKKDQRIPLTKTRPRAESVVNKTEDKKLFEEKTPSAQELAQREAELSEWQKREEEKGYLYKYQWMS